MVSAQVQKKKEVSLEVLNDLIIESIQDIKGKNIVKLDLRKLDAPADYFIICEGDSNTQVKAIANNISKQLFVEHRQKPNHIEGKENGHWVLVDYFNTIIHVFYKETRAMYNLEGLWSDAGITEYQDL